MQRYKQIKPLYENIHIGDFNIIERKISNNDFNISIGLANISAKVGDIEFNKNKIVEAIKLMKLRNVNMCVFPEFCLAGYFWDTTPQEGIDNEEQIGNEDCWNYMDEAVIENHVDWVEKELKGLLDENLQFIIFNNIRKGNSENRKYMNSTYIVHKDLDFLNENLIYDKCFLPGIEKTYTNENPTDRLVIDTKWGRFGFLICYDLCFSELLREYSQVDKVDAIIEMASWRGTAERDYEVANVKSDVYYGDLWNMLIPTYAAINQVWIVACNAVGVHDVSNAKFWGGSGLWAPSGLKIIQASHSDDELLILHNIDIKGQKEFEKEDFDYNLDFNKIYNPIKGKRCYTRIK
jgi:predicted amidohydrolase